MNELWADEVGRSAGRSRPPLLGVPMNLRLRARLILAVVPPFVLIAGLALLNMSPAILAASAVVAGLAAAGGVLLLTVPFERLRVAAEEAVRQAPDVASESSVGSRPTDGTGEIANAIWILLDRLTRTHASLLERNLQFSSAIDQASRSLSLLANESPGELPKFELPSPWPERSAALVAQIVQAGRLVTYGTRRVQAFHAILNELPDGVLVLNDRIQVKFANGSAARLLPPLDLPSGAVLANCFVDPGAAAVADPDAPQPLPAAQVVSWIQQPRGERCLGAANDGNATPIEIRVLSVPSGKFLKGYRVLQLRDVSGERRDSASARERNRREIGQRLCRLVNDETAPAIESVRTQAGLLAQAAKQAGQRDRFLPKVTRLLEELGRQELVVTLLGWLGRSMKSEGTNPDAVEVRCRDVVDGVFEKVQSAFRERANALEVHGDCGWLVADEDWLVALVSGVLLHANHAVAEKAVRLELRKRSGGVGQLELSELAVRYPGPPISSDLTGDILEPFGRLQSTALSPSSAGDGFPIGLAVAARIARLMGGELQLDHENDIVSIRALLPTRQSHTPPPRLPAPGMSEPKFEQTDFLGEWNVGGNVAFDLNDTGATDATLHLSQPVAEFEDDTVGNWFGGSSE